MNIEVPSSNGSKIRLYWQLNPNLLPLSHDVNSSWEGMYVLWQSDLAFNKKGIIFEQPSHV